jgi:oligoribonuclease
MRDAHRHPGGHERPASAPAQDRVLASHEVDPGVTRPGVRGEREVRVEAHERHGQHGSEAYELARPALTAASSIAAVLAWIDLEMTGLDPAQHVIVEIATLLTDDDLNLIAEGPDLVVHATDDELARMGDTVTQMHTRSGLLDEIRASTLTRAEAGARTLAFLRQHITTARTVPLCGNSIGTDRRFLAAQLPEIEEFLHYRSVDVSTLKELAKRWNAPLLAGAPRKAEGHRALDDIRESVEELRYYRDHLIVLAENAPTATPTDAPEPSHDGGIDQSVK